MEVTYHSIAKVFSTGGDTHYVMPYGQRAYSWGKDEWETLWRDIIAIYDEYQPEPPPEHFLGSLVVVSGGNVHGLIPVFIVFDGQQRLTTISLLFCALRDVIKEQHPGLAKQISRLLINEDAPGDVFFKLLPTLKNSDRSAYRALITGKELPKSENESLLTQAYRYFLGELRREIRGKHIIPEQFYVVIGTSLQVVLMTLGQHERPHRIFESLNAKGKPLTQSDLIRNYIAMTLPMSQQEAVFHEAWDPIESWLNDQRSVARIGELSAFIRHYLAMHTGVLCSEDHIYARFRDWMGSRGEGLSAELVTLKRFAHYYYTVLNPSEEPDEEIKRRLYALNILEASTAYPFLLALFEARHTRSVSHQEIIAILDILENYLVRRYLASEQSGYTNRMFPTLWREVRQGETDRSLPEAISAALATKNCPTDREVRDAVCKRRRYRGTTSSKERIQYILERIDRRISAGTDTIVLLDGHPTIEHIMPQTLSDEWRTELGPEADQIQREYGDTLGNLTLVTQQWNNKLSNRPFEEKRVVLAQHGLRINSAYFAQPIEHWDEQAIQQRANVLADHILALWPSLGVAATPVRSAARIVPQTLMIQNERYPVRLWRDVVWNVAEYTIRQGAFEAARVSVPTLFEQDDEHRSWSQEWKLLSNGWRVRVYMDQGSVRRVCQRLLSAAGVAIDAWHIEDVMNNGHDV